MGSGKSTTGKKLAKKLGYEFLDSDTLIVEQYGMSINEIFDHLGEESFRESETRLLKELISRSNLVVSTGGGLPCHSGNMDIINRNGISIYLKVSYSVLFNRLLNRKYKRPLIRNLSDQELKFFIEKKLSRREPFYNKATHIVRGLDVEIDELVDLIRE